MKTLIVLLVMAAASATIFAADPPQTDVTNGILKAHLYLPDAERGYYRGTRFDWSGVISSLELKGHNFFGQWFEKYDPKIHDAIQGPVEEFLTGDSALGYDEAKTGELFVRIGVGALRKPDEKAFRRFSTYDIADPGKWTVKIEPHGGATYTHELKDTNGYAYVYTKTLRLPEHGSEMVLDHTLRNTGKKPIDTSVYNHNFYMLDGLPTSPDTVIKFPFNLKNLDDMKGLAAIRGSNIVYLSELQKGQTMQTFLEGYGGDASDFDIRVENRKAGIGVRQSGNRPITKLLVWSIRSTVCPEAYIHMRIEPGKEFTWQIAYEFYLLDPPR